MPAPKKPAKRPDKPKAPDRAPASKASRPDVQPLDAHLAALLNPALTEPKPTVSARRRSAISRRRAPRTIRAA